MKTKPESFESKFPLSHKFIIERQVTAFFKQELQNYYDRYDIDDKDARYEAIVDKLKAKLRRQQGVPIETVKQHLKLPSGV